MTVNLLESKQTNASYEINDVRQIPQHLALDKIQDLVVSLWDFDDTLCMSGHKEASHLGGIAWRADFRNTIAALKDELKDPLIFSHVTLFLAKAVHVSAVQPETASLIAEQQKLGVKVCIFTARGRKGENSWYQLNIAGVDTLTEQQMKKAEIHMIPQKPLQHDKIYGGYMICAQNVSKELLIQELFEKKVLDPKEIALLTFADDKGDQVKVVQKKVAEYGVPFIGFHYTAVQIAEMKEYNLLEATIQLVNLIAKKKFLSREEVELQKAGKTPEYFKNVVRHLDKLFVENQLVRSYEDTDQFYSAVSKVFEQKGASLLEVK